MAAGVEADGSLGATGALNVRASKTITALGQNLAAGDLTLSAGSVDLSGSATSGRNLSFTATTGDLDLTAADVTAANNFTLKAAQTLRADKATLSAPQFNTSAYSLSNIYGDIRQTGVGDWSMTLAGNLDNTHGLIAANSANLTLSAATLTNTAGSLLHAGTGDFTINATTLTGKEGEIESNNRLILNAGAAILDGASTVARQLALTTPVLSNKGGQIQQFGTAAGSISAAALFDNTAGSLSSNGSFAVTAGNLINQDGSILAGGDQTDLGLSLTGALDNSNKGVVGAGGKLGITANAVDNSTGSITAGNTANIFATNAFTNAQGLLAANNAVELRAAAIDNTKGVIGSVQKSATLTVTSGTLANTSGRIEAANLLTVASHGVNNTDGLLLGGSLALNSQDSTFDNTRGKVVGSVDSLAIDSSELTNDAGLIQAKGALSVDTHGYKTQQRQLGNHRRHHRTGRRQPEDRRPRQPPGRHQRSRRTQRGRQRRLEQQRPHRRRWQREHRQRHRRR